ncbi:MAG: hypothetical protein ACKVI4_16535, partial [Actinomycetales bacterium]
WWRALPGVSVRGSFGRSAVAVRGERQRGGLGRVADGAPPDWVACGAARVSPRRAGKLVTAAAMGGRVGTPLVGRWRRWRRHAPR